MVTKYATQQDIMRLEKEIKTLKQKINELLEEIPSEEDIKDYVEALLHINKEEYISFEELKNKHNNKHNM